MRKRKLKLRIQCRDKDGQRGTFLVDEDTGEPATRTFDSAWRLFNSQDYQQLKKDCEINLTP